MAQSVATKTKAPILVGTSVENSRVVVNLPKRDQVVSLMEMVATLIKKHGRISTMRMITSRHWLYLDANTTKDDDPMAVPGFGVALKDDDPRVLRKALRFIAVDKDWIERYTLIPQAGKDRWQQRGQHTRIPTPKVETKADAARLAEKKAKKAAASKATKSAGAAKKPATPKVKGEKTASKQQTTRKGGRFYTAEQYVALEAYARSTGNTEHAEVFNFAARVAKKDRALAQSLVLKLAA